MNQIKNTIADRIAAVRQEIFQAASQANRDPGDIILLAVSKTKPASDIEAAFSVGLRHFGENYLQEALAKMQALQHLSVTWHYIGRIQSNKTRQIAENFTWVHTLDNIKHARRISEQRPDGLTPMNVCIQVNISEEASKGGILAAQVSDLAFEISKLPNLKLRGLMTIPAATDQTALQRRAFKKLARLLTQLNDQGLSLDTLSMGMSGDMAIAIQEGATILRIGTAIFGPRQ